MTDQTASKSFLTPTRTGSLYYLIALFGAGSFMPFIYVYLNELGLSGKQVGWLSILSPLMMLLLATAIASYADRHHRRRRIAQIALATTAVSVFLLGLPTSFTGIAVLMLALAIFSSPNMTLGDSLISRMAHRHKLNFGGMRLWGSLGYAVSAILFGAIWQNFGFEPMFVVTALFYLPQIMIMGKLEEGAVASREKRVPVALVFQNSSMLLLLLASFLSGISNILFMTFGGIYARSLGGGDLLVGLMVAFGGLAELPTMFYSDRIANRLGKVNTVILSFGLMAIAYLGYILITDPNYIPLFSILKGFGYGLWFPITVRLLIQLTPDEWAATAQSLLTVTWFGLSPLVAGPMGGWIHDAISPAAVFGLGIISLGLAALVLWFSRLRGKLD